MNKMTHELHDIQTMSGNYNVTPRTLRFYESKELLSPIREGQHRLYTRRDRARLKLILQGKRFGFSLEEIRELLNLYDLGDQQSTQLVETYRLATKRLEIMISQRNELTEAIKELKEKLSWGEALIKDRGILVTE
jgi:DNA-binding transcriptional MerR regulator